VLKINLGQGLMLSLMIEKKPANSWQLFCFWRMSFSAPAWITCVVLFSLLGIMLVESTSSLMVIYIYLL